MMGFVSLSEEDKRRWCSSSLDGHLQTRKRVAIKARKRVRPSEPHHADTLISEFPASKALRNKSLFFKPLSL